MMSLMPYGECFTHGPGWIHRVPGIHCEWIGVKSVSALYMVTRRTSSVPPSLRKTSGVSLLVL